MTMPVRLGDLAKIIGKSPGAIRRYFEFGAMLPTTASGARSVTDRHRYSTADIARLLQIRSLIESGLTLATVAKELDRDPDLGLVDALQEIADTIEQHETRLRRGRQALNKVIADCATRRLDDSHGGDHILAANGQPVDPSPTFRALRALESEGSAESVSETLLAHTGAAIKTHLS